MVSDVSNLDCGRPIQNQLAISLQHLFIVRASYNNNQVQHDLLHRVECHNADENERIINLLIEVVDANRIPLDRQSLRSITVINRSI